MRMAVLNCSFALLVLFLQPLPTLFIEYLLKYGFLKHILSYHLLHLLDQPKICLSIPVIMSILMANAITLTFPIGETTFRYDKLFLVSLHCVTTNNIIRPRTLLSLLK